MYDVDVPRDIQILQSFAEIFIDVHLGIAARVQPDRFT
jgi:hypothetical protein